MAVTARLRWRRFDAGRCSALGGWETVPLSTGDKLPLIRVVSWSRGEWHIQLREGPDPNFADGWHWVDVLVPETGPKAAKGYLIYPECSTAQQARAAVAEHWEFIAGEARPLLAEGLQVIAEREKQAKAQDEISRGLDEVEQKLDAAGIPASRWIMRHGDL